MADGFYIGQVEGVQEVLNALDQFAPELHESLVSGMGNAANAIAGAVESALPGEPPTRGFNHYGRTGWNSNRGGAEAIEEPGGMPGTSGDWPVYRIALTGAAGQIADIAGAGGRGSSIQGQAMIAALRRHGDPSRWVWPTAKGATGKMVSAMEAACDKAEDATTAKLAEGA